MRFRTIILTKKNIIISLAVIVLLCSGTAFGISTLKSREIVAVFASHDVYDAILKEGLPKGEEKDYFKEFLDRLLGFDIAKPQTIIENNSPIFSAAEEVKKETENEGDASQAPELKKENKPESTTEPTPTQVADSTQYPAKEQINSFSGVEISNATGYQINSGDMIKAPLSFEIKKDKSPQVLIVHTHTTESYGEFGDRNTDTEKNVVRVGAQIKAVLEEEGIGVIHDTTAHDYPSYQGAYNRAYKTITKNLSQYPDIKIVLDVHRDGYVYADGSRLKMSADVNGESTAQVMIVSGTDALGLENPNWRENLKLGTKIQSAASIMYPSLMRPINLRRERFNMHLTTGSLLIEVGANGNSLEEAIRGGYYFAKALAAVIR